MKGPLLILLVIIALGSIGCASAPAPAAKSPHPAPPPAAAAKQPAPVDVSPPKETLGTRVVVSASRPATYKIGTLAYDRDYAEADLIELARSQAQDVWQGRTPYYQAQDGTKAKLRRKPGFHRGIEDSFDIVDEPKYVSVQESVTCRPSDVRLWADRDGSWRASCTVHLERSGDRQVEFKQAIDNGEFRWWIQP